VSCGLHIANDVALLTELLELLVPALETVASEATYLGLEVNWQKTKVQALGSREDVPSTITVLGQELAVVEEFIYLSSLVHSTTQSSLISHVAINQSLLSGLPTHVEHMPSRCSL